MLVLIAALIVCLGIDSVAIAASPGPQYLLQTITLPDGSQHTLRVARGLSISLYASGLPNARFMAQGPNGVIFVGSWYNGTISALLPRPGLKTARTITLIGNLTVPHSMTFRNGSLYVAEENQVTIWRYNPATLSVSAPRRLISLPVGGRHVTRTIVFGPDGMLYISVGSLCDLCATDAVHGAILRYRADGTGRQVFAAGLRNAVGLAWDPLTGMLWAADNGSDFLGDPVPPDELDIIRQGGNYGWPYCWGKGESAGALPSAPGYCAHTINPVALLPAHSAPLGIAFARGTLLPTNLRSSLFVAYHGSEYRSQPVGYKVVAVPVKSGHAGSPQDLVSGWLPSAIGASGGVWGRPVGLLMAADGSLLVSDDLAGVIYRLAPTGK